MPVIQAEQDLRDANEAWVREGADGLPRVCEVRQALTAARQNYYAVLPKVPAAVQAEARAASDEATALQAGGDRPVAGALARQTAAIGAAMTLLNRVMDASGLRVDENLGVRYALDAGLGLGTPPVETVANARTLTVSALQRKEASAEERAVLRKAAGRLRVLTEQSSEAMEGLQAQAASQAERVNQLKQDLAQTVRFADIIDRAVVNAAELTMPAAPVASLGGKAAKAAQGLSLGMRDVARTALAERGERAGRVRLLVIGGRGRLRAGGQLPGAGFLTGHAQWHRNAGPAHRAAGRRRPAVQRPARAGPR